MKSHIRPGIALRHKIKRITVSRRSMIMVAVGFALIGVIVLALTRAAANDVMLEAESATRTGSVQAIADANASGGQALHFGAAPTGGGGGTNVGGFTLPIKVSGNNRYLVDQSGKAFLLTADTAWTLLSQVPDRAEVDAYMDARKAQGFNTIATCMTCWDRDTNRGGVNAFSGGDLTQPNDQYFAFIDQIVKDAADRGLVLLMGPLWLAGAGVNSQGGVPPESAWQSYGSYLGNRYKAYDNIIWFLGGDHQAQQSWDDTTDYTAYIDAMAAGIQSNDTRHIITFHPSYDSLQLAEKSWLAFYAYEQKQQEGEEWTYDRTQTYYEHSPTKPVLNMEPPYEDHMSAYIERRNAWWSLLSGALGVQYGGASSAWNIRGGYGWQGEVGSLKGAPQVGLVNAIAGQFNWQNLVPDYGFTTLTTGAGGGGDQKATAGMSPSGDVFMAYVPSGRGLSVDMSKFSGAANAFWFDPANGTKQSAGDGLANSGTKSFETPGNNSAGDSDWTLVISKQ